MTRRRRRQRFPDGEFDAQIASMSHDGRGITRIDDKATFIHGALPGEQVKFRYTQRKKAHDEGIATQILQASAQRVEPHCAHYEVCGGCSLQHLDAIAQIEAKQQILLDNLQHIGKVAPQQVLPPLRNTSPWGYRRKARLGVKYVEKKGGVLVGFRERASAFIADMHSCVVLHPQVGQKLLELRALIEGLSIRDRLPQIEMAMDDQTCVLILRVLDPPSVADREQLLDFAERHQVVFYLQPGGPETVQPLQGDAVDLHYRLLPEVPDQELTLGFLPGDFTQVNTEMNRQMVTRALELLDPHADDQVLDLFCGVGNFTLPLARRAGQVVGIEGDAGLVERAEQNARRNQLDNVAFYTANLYEELAPATWRQQKFNKALLDPPRSGAQQVLGLLPQLGVESLLYISCYPGTLARDAGELVHEHGYKLHSAGVMDMFPHTAHVESIALFRR